MEQWQKNIEVILKGGGSPQARTPRERPVEKGEEDMAKIFIMMRFYDGGGLASFRVVACSEDELEDLLIKFEEDCDSQNLGNRIGVLELEEFNKISKEIKECRI